jgi:kynurenine formamidase
MREQALNPWGTDDQIGAMNYVLAETLVPLLKSVERGKIYDLSQVIEMGAPQVLPFQSPFVQSMYCTAGNTRRLLAEAMNITDGAGAFLERVEMTMHVGTHIDALGHFATEDQMYNGNTVTGCGGDWGLTRLGIEHCPPIVTRAVVVDVAGFKGVAHLDGGAAITPSDLEGALKKQKSTIRPGDAVLVHTGWGKHYMVDNATYVRSSPGLGEEAARWLSAQKVSAIGADNMGLEVTPMEDERKAFPVHQHLIVEKGVYIIENLKLSEPCADGMYEFPFILLPTKYKGATACPVRPIGVV